MRISFRKGGDIVFHFQKPHANLTDINLGLDAQITKIEYNY